MGVIEIEGMEFYAYHGHYAEEQIVGNRFILDVTLITDCEKAAESDNLMMRWITRLYILLLKKKCKSNHIYWSMWRDVLLADYAKNLTRLHMQK